MAITSSAKKALRQSFRKKIFNLARKEAIYTVTKKIKKLIKEKKTAEAKAMLPELYKAYDKAAKTNYIKKNTASRKKSRMAIMVAKTGAK
jgi:small subunit ribosomal protein S20